MVAIVKAVDKGEAWLDKNKPGWWEKVDLKGFQMHSSCLCVLGQLSPQANWLVILRRHNLTMADSVAMGFDAEDGESYPALTAEWKKRIKARRKG